LIYIPFLRPSAPGPTHFGLRTYLATTRRRNSPTTPWVPPCRLTVAAACWLLLIWHDRFPGFKSRLPGKMPQDEYWSLCTNTSAVSSGTDVPCPLANLRCSAPKAVTAWRTVGCLMDRWAYQRSMLTVSGIGKTLSLGQYHVWNSSSRTSADW